MRSTPRAELIAQALSYDESYKEWTKRPRSLGRVVLEVITAPQAERAIRRSLAALPPLQMLLAYHEALQVNNTSVVEAIGEIAHDNFEARMMVIEETANPALQFHNLRQADHYLTISLLHRDVQAGKDYKTLFLDPSPDEAE